MAIELEDGTIVRSLPEQVDYLTTRNEENENAIDNLAARLEAAIAGVLHYKGSVATYDDLPEEAEVGDVYNVIDTGANYAWTGNEWDELGSSIDTSNLMDLISNQTSSGVKSFINGLITKSIAALDQNLNILFGGDTKYQIQGNAIYPITDGGASLGTRLLRWLNLCLSGKINPNSSNFGLTLPDTSGFTADKEIGLAEGTFNVIKASDIVNNTLTQAQYDLITNGKPTLISGTILSRTDILLVSFGGGSTKTFIGFSNTLCEVFLVNSNTLVFSREASSTGKISLQSIVAINGKNIPAYPSSTGTWVMKCINGVLTWVQEQ